MRGFGSVYAKEMRAYLVSPIPYILVALFTPLIGWLFFRGLEQVGMYDFWLLRRASLDNLFAMLPIALAAIVPALTMRLWSEEYRAGTIETLGTLPITSGALVLGKFLAAWTLLAFSLVALLPIVFAVGSLGDLDGGPVLGGFLGALFLGSALLALGMWISALTRHQVVAFLITLAAGVVLTFLLTKVAGGAGGATGRVLSALALDARFESLGRGVLEVRDLAYFGSFTCFFLYLNAETVDNRRYR